MLASCGSDAPVERTTGTDDIPGTSPGFLIEKVEPRPLTEAELKNSYRKKNALIQPSI